VQEKRLVMNSRTWLTIWICLIVLVVVPWRTLEAHAHWERMAWIPFVSPPVDVGDVLGNVAFYVPYGMLVAQEAADTPSPITIAAGSAVLLSLATEFTQIFSVTRFPSMTDVACNAIGAFVGAKWTQRRYVGK
jgi:glycopeptide antibiotics resistance protein